MLGVGPAAPLLRHLLVAGERRPAPFARASHLRRRCPQARPAELPSPLRAVPRCIPLRQGCWKLSGTVQRYNAVGETAV